MNSPKDYLTDKEPTREIEDWEKEFDDFADQNEDDDCGCENFYWYDSPRTVKKFIKALLTETIQQSMEVWRDKFLDVLQKENMEIQKKYYNQGESSSLRYEQSMEIRRALSDLTNSVIKSLSPKP